MCSFGQFSCEALPKTVTVHIPVNCNRAAALRAPCSYTRQIQFHTSTITRVGLLLQKTSRQMRSYTFSSACSFYLLSLIQRHITLMLCYRLISRTDNLTFIDNLFNTVCTPSCNTCNRKDWCI